MASGTWSLSLVEDQEIARQCAANEIAAARFDRF